MTPSGPSQPEHGRAAPRPVRQTLRPWLQPRLTIDQYTQHELGQLARWIESDGTLRTEDQVLAEMMAELGFQRRGSKIAPALRAAIRMARGRAQ